MTWDKLALENLYNVLPVPPSHPREPVSCEINTDYCAVLEPTLTVTSQDSLAKSSQTLPPNQTLP